MIENIPTELLYDEDSRRIMNRFEDMRTEILTHGFELNRAGTNSVFYSILDFMLSGFGPKSRAANFLKRRFLGYLIARGRVPVSYVKVVWTRDVVSSSTLPYPVRRTEYPWAISMVGHERFFKILDIGSGVSLLPIYLAAKGHDVTSIDNDAILMNKISPLLAKWNKVEVKYGLGDAIKLQFEDNSFDRVLCISVLEHLEEEKIDDKYVNYHKQNLDVIAIADMLRVLRPGGLLILTFDWSENPDDPRSYRLQDIYDRVIKPYRGLLVKDGLPEINWEALKAKHIAAWKAFPPFDYVTEGWAMGVVLQKKG
jgi:SAM-dependent methyltransferase